MMGYSIDAMSALRTDNAVLSRLNLLLGKLLANGFAIPRGPNLNREQMSLYMHQVGTYLREGNLEAAKGAAERMVVQASQVEDY
jgi:hypothetical protein